MSGSSAKRVSLSSALNTGLEVDHSTPDLGASPTDEYILPRLRLFNNTTQDIPFSELTLRYWYTIDNSQSQTFMCDYLAAFFTGCPYSPSLTGLFTNLPSNSPNKTSLSDTYREVGFASTAGTFTAGSQVEMYLRIFKTDLSNFNETNDYSYDPSRPNMSRWERITVYRNGVLVWGIEPTSSTALTMTPTQTATRTATAATPTATRTRTPTSAVSTVTPTKTLTLTPLAPTNTPIAATPTPGGGSCSPVTSTISAPFTYDGAGTFCWKSSNLGSYINNWNMTSLTINGANFTNMYIASGSYPAQIGGYWYVSYNGPYAWSHFEAK